MGDPERSVLPDYCRKPVVVLGCGNVLFGDDGFGCAVVGYIEKRVRVPSHVCLVDAGTGARKLLFTLCLSRRVPRRLLIVDAIDAARAPGELFEVRPSEIPAVKRDDFSMHQLPTSDMLRELQELRGVEVRVLACQTGPLPQVVRPGLSDPVRGALAKAAAWISEEYFGPLPGEGSAGD